MLPLSVISHQKTYSSSYPKWQNRWAYIVLALLKRARSISASLITLRSLCKLMMNVMSGSMGSGDLLSQKPSKNSWNVATLLTGLPESAVNTVAGNYFWPFLAKDVHFAQVAI